MINGEEDLVFDEKLNQQVLDIDTNLVKVKKPINIIDNWSEWVLISLYYKTLCFALQETKFDHFIQEIFVQSGTTIERLTTLEDFEDKDQSGGGSVFIRGEHVLRPDSDVVCTTWPVVLAASAGIKYGFSKSSDWLMDMI